MSNTNQEDALDMVRKGLPVNSVADFFGVSRQYIYKLAADNGVILPRLKSRKEHPQTARKFLANNLVTHAIAKGILIPEPCEICGLFGKDAKGRSQVEAHHDDYNKPLEVRWLCREHHAYWHKYMKPKY